MIRNLKVLGLALVAVFAFSAMSASGASAAVGTLTSDGEVTLDATENAGTVNALTAFGGKTECPGSTITGHKYNTTPHQLIPNDVSTITLTPDYVNCKVVEGGTTHFATVTMNECDYTLHIGETIGATSEYSTTVDVECVAGHSIVVDVYGNATNELFPGKVCEITVGPQTGLTGATAKNKGTTEIELNGTYTGISASKSGLCGAGTTTTGEFDIHATATGTNAGGTATGISISHL